MPANRRTFLLGAATTVFVPMAAARVVSENRLGTRMLDITIDSPALGAAVPVRLLLPPGWTPGSSRSWPVLYLLHGAGDDYTSWTRSTDVSALVQQQEMLVVMPSGGRDGFYSDWRTGQHWETFHLTEMLPIIERGYGASGTRVIAGLSMGGFGAMSYAARHPGMFQAAASYSGLLHTRQSARSTSLIQGVLVKDGYDPFALWGDPIVNAAVWAGHNPYDLADRLLGIPLYVACGDGQVGPLDPPGALPDFAIEPVCRDQSTAFIQRVRQLGGTVTANIYSPGTHNWGWWQRELHSSFPMLTTALA
ncbi:alpha/beta hydrolase family protein [Actinocrispum sp. NPDC049592]|uniref:alpha/beta hydrolase n=1 Tax=Actinocrispum sp. NPDC049592 TaxID=3154835 RepID=UPI00342BC4AE